MAKALGLDGLEESSKAIGKILSGLEVETIHERRDRIRREIFARRYPDSVICPVRNPDGSFRTKREKNCES